MSKIQVKNVSSSTVVLVARDIRFRRELAPGRVIPIDEEVFEELSFDPGFHQLVKTGFITVKGLDAETETKIEEAIEEVSEVETVELSVIKKEVAAHNSTWLAQTLPEASQATKDSIVKFSVEEKITDAPFVALIKKYCNVDLAEAVAHTLQAEG